MSTKSRENDNVLLEKIALRVVNLENQRVNGKYPDKKMLRNNIK